MAYAYKIYTSTTSGQEDFQFTFPYINAEHVKLYVNYTEIAYAVATRGAGVAGFQIHTSGGNTYARLNDTNGLSSANIRVEVRRISSLASVLVDYADGSTLVASDLDTSNLQHLYIAQELDDDVKRGLSIDPATGLPTLGSQRLTNVADPTAAQDAATKNYVDTTKQPLDAELTELATMASTTASALADLTQAEVQAIDGLTASTAELNKLDGVTATTAEINYVDGVTSNVQTQLDAKQPLDAELTELATMASDTASSLADLTAGEVQTLDGITSSTSELNILDGVTATAAELNTLDGVASTLTAAELNFLDGVTSALQTQLNGKQPLDADLTALSNCQTGAATNIALLTSGEVAILDDATVTTAELNTLDGITASTGELNKLDGVTSTAANLNVVSGMTKATTLTSNSDTEFPTSKAVNDRILTVTNALGGFVAIANETSFPTANPDPSDGAGTVVSISDAGGVVVNGSGVATIANGAGSGNTVTINGFPSALQSKTLGAGIGLQVQTTTTLHTYTYHKVLAKEADVEQLSGDINDFNERYRTGGSNPNSDNDAGDLFFNTGTDKMYVRNAANNAWDEVVSVGEFFINTLSSAGSGSDSPPGGSATFNGTARKFTLSNPPSVAQQLVVSINGVIQKPNTGTGFPSEGFSLNGSVIQFAAAPATNAPFFIITIGSTVNIGTPSSNTVDYAKLKVSNTGSNGQVLSKSGATEGLTWIDSATDKITVGDTTAEVTDTGSNGTFKITLDGATTESFSVTDTALNLGRHGSNTANSDLNLSGAIKFGFTNSGVYPYIRTDGSGYLEITGAYGGGSSIGTVWTFGGYQGTHVSGGNINPSADSTYSLGTNSVRWTNVYADNLYGDGSNLTGVSSAEVYGFNQNSTGNLIVTTTNGGADNISASDYAAFEDTIFAATGISFSINTSGNLIATIS